MTEEEALQALSVGIDLVRECKDKGYQLIGTGEMGIGNTTTSSMLVAALTGRTAEEVTGRGDGLNDAGLLRKQQPFLLKGDSRLLWAADLLFVRHTERKVYV